MPILNGFPQGGGGKEIKVTEFIVASCTWTAPPGIKDLTVTCVGGGQGGRSGRADGGRGGAAGSVITQTVNIAEGEEVSVTIGLGGASDKDGGSTSFGTYVTAPGGTGESPYPGGTSTGELAAAGGRPGSPANTTGNSSTHGVGPGGAGGQNSPYGTGGSGGTGASYGSDSASSGCSGTGFGSGGGGGGGVGKTTNSSEGVGGTGAPGLCILTYTRAA